MKAQVFWMAGRPTPIAEDRRADARLSQLAPVPDESNRKSAISPLNWQRSIDHIILTASSDANRVLGLTSARQGAGVSLMCRNIARRLAETGSKTLLIDVSNFPQAAPAVQAVRTASVSIQDKIVASEDGYDVLTTAASPECRHLLSSLPRFRETLKSDLAAYQRVVIDMPAQLDQSGGALNPAALAALCDSVLLVCLVGEDKRSELIEVLSLMRTAGVKLSGLISNEHTRVDAWKEFAQLLRLRRKDPDGSAVTDGQRPEDEIR